MISKVRVNLCAVKTFWENSALWNKNKDSIPLNLLANLSPQKAKWTKPHKQTSIIGEMILYAYFNMNHDSNDSKKYVKIIWDIEFE